MLTSDGVPTLTSVYQLDGADLRMTHYCAAGNQPRLKAERIDVVRGILDFGFIDATNLSSPQAAHVHGLELRFIDTDHITITFLFQSAGRENREGIALTRVTAGEGLVGEGLLTPPRHTHPPRSREKAGNEQITGRPRRGSPADSTFVPRTIPAANAILDFSPDTCFAAKTDRINVIDDRLLNIFTNNGAML
jgi:hypothetical protein